MGEKLIRQNIELPESATTRRADPSELDRLLGAKLVEEAKELRAVLETPLDDPQTTLGGRLDGRRHRIVDEAADLLEVLNVALYRHSIPGMAVEVRIERHNTQRGGFVDRVLTGIPDDREAQLQLLVEDQQRALIQIASGVADKAMADKALSEFHERAVQLGCVGTNAKTIR